MKPLDNITDNLAGRYPLPAGAVPLATDQPGSVVCITAPGRWVRWWPGTRSIEAMPSPDTQRAVIGVIIAQLGGTAATTAVALDVSHRTVEAWRTGRDALPVRTAHRIATAIAERRRSE